MNFLQGAIMHQRQISPASPPLPFTTFSHITAGVSTEIIRPISPVAVCCLPSIRDEMALPDGGICFPRAVLAEGKCNVQPLHCSRAQGHHCHHAVIDHNQPQPQVLEDK